MKQIQPELQVEKLRIACPDYFSMQFRIKPMSKEWDVELAKWLLFNKGKT